MTKSKTLPLLFKHPITGTTMTEVCELILRDLEKLKG